MSRTQQEILNEIAHLSQEMAGQPPEQQVQTNARIQALLAQMRSTPAVDTGGGAMTEGDVNTEGGDFVGRDQNVEGDLVHGDKAEGDLYKAGRDLNQTTHNTTINAPDPVTEARNTYLQKLAQHCNALPLAAMGDEHTTGEGIGLNNVYIALDTRTRVPLTPEEAQNKSWRDPDDRPLTAVEATEKHTRLVLLGGPGSGKSSFVRQLTADTARAVLNGETDILPLFMILRDLAPRLRDLPHEPPLSEQQENDLQNAIFEQWTADITQFGGEQFCGQGLHQAVADGRVLLVFDGLDELPEPSRPAVWRAIDVLLSRHQQVRQVIVTCRVRSYTGTARFPSFTDYTLAPFDEDKIKAFVVGWYQAQVNLGRLKPDEAEERVEDLQPAATGDELRKLAEIPLLLTVMTIIHQRETRLPKERVKLYEQAVDVLLRRWQQAKGLTLSAELKALLDDDLRIRPLLERLAYDLHQKQAAQADARLSWGDLIYLLSRADYLDDAGLATEFLTYIDQRTGLLVGHGGHTDSGQPPTFDFPHRTFQEYLAGCHLVRGLPKKITAQLREKADHEDYWRVPVQLGLEELHFNRRGQEILCDVAGRLLAPSKTTPRQQVWSGYIADLVGVRRIVAELSDLGIGEQFETWLQAGLLAIVQDEVDGLTIIERAEGGRLLNLVGDPRPGVGVDENGWPDIVWGETVPVGRYDYVADGYEVTQAYQLARYPVTYAQFQAFVEADDYDDERWWRGMPEEQHGEVTKVLSEQAFKYGNHPRERVAWYQAVAFCRWLSDRLGYEVMLPHEHQWEVAARYNDGRRYPWGDEFVAEKANTNESGIGQTTAVGLYPAGRQPELDLYDMSGNVWEWCLNQYREPEQVGVDDTGAARALRGGSWDDDRDYARAASRNNPNPNYRLNYFGFRLVRRSPSHVH